MANEEAKKDFTLGRPNKSRFHFETEEALENHIIEMIEAGEKLTEDEIEAMVLDGQFRYFEEEICDTSWNTRRIHTIVRLNDRFFEIDWERGLTEMQDNTYYCQPYEVEGHTHTKTITVTEWAKIDKDKEIQR